MMTKIICSNCKKMDTVNEQFLKGLNLRKCPERLNRGEFNQIVCGGKLIIY